MNFETKEGQYIRTREYQPIADTMRPFLSRGRLEGNVLMLPGQTLEAEFSRMRDLLGSGARYLRPSVLYLAEKMPARAEELRSRKEEIASLSESVFACRPKVEVLEGDVYENLSETKNLAYASFDTCSALKPRDTDALIERNFSVPLFLEIRACARGFRPGGGGYTQKLIEEEFDRFLESISCSVAHTRKFVASGGSNNSGTNCLTLYAEPGQTKLYLDCRGNPAKSLSSSYQRESFRRDPWRYLSSPPMKAALPA